MPMLRMIWVLIELGRFCFLKINPAIQRGVEAREGCMLDGRIWIARRFEVMDRTHTYLTPVL